MNLRSLVVSNAIVSEIAIQCQCTGGKQGIYEAGRKRQTFDVCQHILFASRFLCGKCII